MQLTQPLHKGLRERPRDLAVVCGSEGRTRADLADRVARLAREAGMGIEVEY